MRDWKMQHKTCFLHAVIESFKIVFCLSCRLKLTEVFIRDRDICITVITVCVTFIEIRNQCVFNGTVLRIFARSYSLRRIFYFCNYINHTHTSLVCFSRIFHPCISCAPFSSLAFSTLAFLTTLVPKIPVSQIPVSHFQRPLTAPTSFFTYLRTYFISLCQVKQ